MLSAQRCTSLVRLVASLALLACGSGSEPTPPAPQQTLTLSVLPAGTLDIAAGRRVVANAIIARGGGFSAPVTLAATGAPAGTIIGLSDTVVTGSGSGAIVTFDIPAAAAAGTYQIAFTASGAGVPTATATKTMNVVPAITLSVAPATLSIAAGSTANAAIAITRGTNFFTDVTLTAPTAPPGLTVSFAPSTIATGTTTTQATIAVGAGVAAGTYPVTITASGQNVASASATLPVTVTSAASGRTASVTYCTGDAPIWVAYSDGGAGPWTRVLPNAGTNTYVFAISSGKAGVVAVDTVGAGFNVAVSFASIDEIAVVANSLGQDACAAKSVSGTFANLTVSQQGSVTLGNATALVFPATSSSYNLRNVKSGPLDLVATRSPIGTSRPDRLILRRGIDIPTGGVVPPIDFGATDTFAPVSANLTVTGVGADTAFAVVNYTGFRGAAEGFIANISPYLSTTGAVPYDAIPSSRLNTGELQRIYVASISPNGGSNQRFSSVFFRNAVNQTLTLGPLLATPTVTRLAGGAYSRTRVQLPFQPDYDRILLGAFSQTASNRSLTITATSGFTGGGAWDFTVPSLTGTTGWLDSWGLVNGSPISWTLTAYAGKVFELDPSLGEGDGFKGATFRGSTPLP